MSQTWVSRLWREHGLRPWRQGTFKISNDPNFEDKVRDVVGLYLDPPEGEVVVSVDAKTGIQALDRTQPLLPIDSARPSSAPSTTPGWAPRTCTPRWTSGPGRSSRHCRQRTRHRTFSG